MKRLGIVLCLLVFLAHGCAPVLESMPGVTHTAALMIGNSKDNVVSQAEHICGKPTGVAYAAKGTPDEFEVRRYKFWVDSDLVLYFYKDIFFQAGLIDPKSTTYPSVRNDYKEMDRQSPGPIGYLLTLQGKVASIKPIERNDKK